MPKRRVYRVWSTRELEAEIERLCSAAKRLRSQNFREELAKGKVPATLTLTTHGDFKRPRAKTDQERGSHYAFDTKQEETDDGGET